MFLSFLTHITLLEVFLDKIFQINDVLHIKYKLSYQTPGWGGGSIAWIAQKIDKLLENSFKQYYGKFVPKLDFVWCS